jgi:hypothetical protein
MQRPDWVRDADSPPFTFHFSPITFPPRPLRSCCGKRKIDLPGVFEERLWTIGCHFTRDLAAFGFIIGQLHIAGGAKLDLIFDYLGPDEFTVAGNRED